MVFSIRHGSTPAAPRAGETVSVNIRGGICDSIFFRPGYPQITQVGNDIRILEYGHHWDTFDLCVYDIGTLTTPVGTFSAGDYMLTVDFIYPDMLGPTPLTLGVIPFTVSGVSPLASVPASTTSGQLALLILVAGAASWTLRVRAAASETGQVAQYAAHAQRLGSSGDC